MTLPYRAYGIRKRNHNSFYQHSEQKATPTEAVGVKLYLLPRKT